MSATPLIQPGQLLKFLTIDGKGLYSGAKWHLPTAEGPGKWMPRIRESLVLCERGYHVTTPAQASRWIAATLYTVEIDGSPGCERLEDDTKIVVQRARLLARVSEWNPKTQRLFACDCAEHVLPLFEKRHPGDERPRKAIEVARRYANGEATKDELRKARTSAAAAAAYAYAASAAAAAAAYAYAAAYAAADAADAAARQAERDWQGALFLEYVSGARG